MSFLFGGKSTPAADPVQEMARNTRIAVRRLERDEAAASKQEEVLLKKIRALAGQGKVASCQAVAKELVRLRHHVKVIGQMRSQMNGLSQKLSVADSTNTIHSTLGKTAKMLGVLNKTLAPRELHKVLLEFQKQNTIFSDGQDILTETLEDAFEAEDENADIDDAVSRVFQEIGLDTEIRATASTGPTYESSEMYDEDDLLKRLERLRT